MPKPPAIPQRQVDADHPWLGLESFTEATRKFFFGRDAEIADIFIRTRENPLTVLYGRSGLGKTSLLGAGLIPKLKLEGYRPVLIRLRYERTDIPLVDQMKDAFGTASTDVPHPSYPNLPSLWELLHHIPTRPTNLPTAPPVLIFDQIEELFTLGQRAERIDEVRALFTELADVIENRPPAALKDRFTADRRLVRDYDLAPTPLRVVITLREDYLSHLEAWKRTLPSLMRNRMALHLLNGPQALDAVFKPGQMEGRRLVDEDTAARIVRFVAGRDSDVPLDEIDAVPPLLSLVCDELNAQRIEQGKEYIVASRDDPGRRIKLTTDAGDPVLIDFGVARRADDSSGSRDDDLEARSRAILQRFYQRSFTGFPQRVQHFVEDRMVTTAGHRCPVSRDDALAALTKARVKDPAEALTTLVTRRLISSEERGGVQWFEITHDVLVPIVKESKDKRLARQRIRRMIAAGAGLFALLGVFGGVTAWSLKKQHEADEARDLADQTVAKLKEADVKQESLLLSASYADHEAALRAFSEHREAEGLAYFERSLRYSPKNTAALAAAAQHSFGMNAPRWRTRAVAAFEESVTCLAFSADGCYLAAGSFDRTVRVIEAATGKEISKAEFASMVTSLSFSPDGRYLAAGEGDLLGIGKARVLEAATGKEVSSLQFGLEVNSVSFSPDGRYLAAGSDDKTARVIEAATGKEISKAEFASGVTSVSFSPDGRYLAAGSCDATARVIEAATGKEISRAEFASGVTSVSFSPDGRYLAAGSDDKTARVLEAATGKEISKAEFASGVTSVSFSPDGLYLAAGSGDYTARVIKAATGREISKAEFGSRVTSVSFSPDGRYLAAGSDDATARVIEAATGKEVSSLQFGLEVTSVSFGPDGRYLAAGSRDGTARVIEAAAGKEIGKAEFGSRVTCVSFSPDGRYLAAGSGDATARVLEAATCKEISRVEFASGVTSVSFSPDGRHLAAGSYDKTARVIEAVTGKEISKAEFGGEVVSLSFSPDGRYLAAGSRDGTARVLEAATGQEISTAKFSGSVTSVSFSPDGIYLAAGSGDYTARVIKAATGKYISSAVFRNVVTSVSFSSDGRHLAACTMDNTMRVIEAATGKEISNAEFGIVVSFSPDGRYLAAGTMDNTMGVIEAATGKEISKAKFSGIVTSVSFSPDGIYLAAGSGDYTARVIEAATGKEISKAEFGNKVTSVSFSPDGRYLAAGSDDETARVIATGWSAADSSVAVPFAKALQHSSCMRFQPDGRLSPRPAADLIQAQNEISAFIRAVPPPSAKWQHAILTWAASAPETRTTSPWTTESLRMAAGRWLMNTNLSWVTADTADEVSWHPLEPVSLARWEPQPDNKTDAAMRETMLIRPRFLARLTLKRLRNADEQIYGRDTLAEYAAWSARIMHEELHLDPEAREALAFALERTPPEKPKALLELKAKLEGK
ncbi:MAG: hypothetical protein K1X78_16655 [Verrucomicrobiaceae bacterium]|nr:hypothetical protein [Verrucomicrobiaceae bacterium]